MNIRSKYLSLLGWALVLIFLISGCYPKGPEFISDYNLVVTDYDTDFSFGSKKTYFMPDTINFETNIDDISDERVRQFEELILEGVESNMADRDYTRIDTTSTSPPDMVITISAVAIENAGVGWVPGPGWGWGYPGWGWGPGYGWGYPGWYPVGYSYSTGTVIIHMGDPDSVVDDEVKVVWLAALDGLLSSNVNTNDTMVRNGINQAFLQSPYIQSNQ